VACLTNISNVPFEGKIKAEIKKITGENILNVLEPKNTESTQDVQYEVLNIASAPKAKSTVKLTESLPETNTPLTSLSAYLIKTPFETKHFAETNNEETKPQPESAGQTQEKETAQLQMIDFDSLEPEEPEVIQDVPEELKLPQEFEIPCTLPKTVEELLNSMNPYTSLTSRKYLWKNIPPWSPPRLMILWTYQNLWDTTKLNLRTTVLCPLSRNYTTWHLIKDNKCRIYWNIY